MFKFARIVFPLCADKEHRMYPENVTRNGRCRECYKNKSWINGIDGISGHHANGDLNCKFCGDPFVWPRGWTTVCLK